MFKKGIGLLLLASLQVSAQSFDTELKVLKLLVDTAVYTWQDDQVFFRGEKCLAFAYDNVHSTALLRISPNSNWHLEAENSYQIQDSLELETYKEYSLQLQSLHENAFPRLRFRNKEGKLAVLPLLAFAETYLDLSPREDELFLGEEKVLNLPSKHAEKIDLNLNWKKEGPIHYRFSFEGNRVLLHLLPKERGRHDLKIPLKLKSPRWDGKLLSYDMEPLQAQFRVKTGRLAFLNLNQQEFTKIEGSTKAIEVQLDDHPFLQLNKTYRIENQEEAGGPLIAELFTKSKLNNNKVLCLLRPYSYHRTTEGYLYIKNGDRARFITNFNLSPQTKVESIFLQRDGKNWEAGSTVYPGEVLNVRIEGEGLHKGDFNFLGAAMLEGDSSVRNENVAYFRLEVPLNISIRSIEIFNNATNLGKSLRVREYQRPKPFDFIDLALGLKRYQLDKIDRPIYYEKTLSDVVIDFDQKKLDRQKELYGKQYLTIKVKISNKKGSLVELYQFDNVLICPDDDSPRFSYYDTKTCRLEDINLNDFINNKTSNLQEWSTIDLEFSHQRDKYASDGYTKKVKIYLSRKINYDIDVSFPAGLLILKAGENDFSNFGGISFAMMAQMSFYHPNKVAKLRPFKFGAGFIALDAFNFSDNSSNRDLGLVVLGSLYPTSSENRLSFPLFVGYGYLLKQQKTFFLIGPGIRVRL